MSAPASPTILIADPDPLVLERAAQALFAAAPRYEIVETREGGQAYRVVQALRPDLVLLAHDLTGIDGPTIVAALTRAPAHRARPFAALVPAGDRAAGAGMLLAGAREVIAKPFEGKDLRARVAALLGRAGPDVGPEGRVLVVCAEDGFRRALGAAIEERAGLRASCTSIGLLAAALAREEPPAAIVAVEPIADTSAVDLLLTLRLGGVGAPVVVVSESTPSCGGLRWVPRARALEETPALLRALLRSAAARPG
jgi:DNA-binding response OmpR family regulator